jgi:integrase
MQPDAEQLAAAGEIVMFHRSWYNRAGVEYVMGFCSEQEHRRFLELCPQIEKYVIDAGILSIKIWLKVGKEEQAIRFTALTTRCRATRYARCGVCSANGGVSSHVFMTERDGPMTPKAFYALFGRIGTRAKMPFPIHPHMLRHGCGYALANAATTHEHAGLARAQRHPTHRALHRVGTASVQGLLALTLPAMRAWNDPPWG